MKKLALLFVAALISVGISYAADIDVYDDIVTSELWTADNVYHLKNLIYIKPGASLTIQPGTIVRGAENGEVTEQTGIVVTSGAQIFAMGTKNKPIIMTSEQDDMQTWRPSCHEWGNLTMLGEGIIAATLDGDGTGQPDGTDTAQMEGLVGSFIGDPNIIYGGNNDDDDSGSISHVSFRYGGFKLSDGVELNGLSLGGIGRGTEIDHIEIMNNADDGIEIWGGTVNIKYVSIWNIGDDSFDLDQGWRGKAQFGLIVQGYCKESGSQGSGIGDNCFEMDGAEIASSQPFGTALIYNFTTIGQPLDGDQGTEWRDNMRAQLHNCIFMDIGDKMVKDGTDGGDGGGYGSAGVPTLAELFATEYNNYPTNTVGVEPNVLYPNFTSGYMCDLTDSIFYNLHETSTLTSFGLDDASCRNIIEPNDMPIAQIDRGDLISVGGKDILPVTYLNPRAANDAVSCDYMAPEDGFFSPAAYVGAFNQYENWLNGWTAAYAFGMTN